MRYAIQKTKLLVYTFIGLAAITAPLALAQPSFADGTLPQYVAAVDHSCTGGLTANCALVKNYIQPLIRFLTAFVGVAVVISIIVGGIQYGSSAGDPAKVSAAKNRIRNSIIALILFIFLSALLNILIPGGLV